MSGRKPTQTLKLMEEAVKHYGYCCSNPSCLEKDVRVLRFVPEGEHGRLQQLYYLSSHNWPKTDEHGIEYRLLCLNCKEKEDQDA